MVSRFLIIFTLSALLFLLGDVNAKLEKPREKPERRKPEFDYEAMAREKLVENHKRRREQLVKLLEETRTQVEDHRAGRRLMEQEEYEKMNKRLGLYEQKLLRMPEHPEETEIKRMLERDHMRMERNSRREL